MTNSEQTKVCTTCKEEKSICEFHKEKKGKYGVKSKCKVCFYEYKKITQRRRNTKELIMKGIGKRNLPIKNNIEKIIPKRYNNKVKSIIQDQKLKRQRQNIIENTRGIEKPMTNYISLRKIFKRI